MKTKFELPTRPYSPIDALNRRAAATGSLGYAMRAAGASYNGHRVTVAFNSHRKYWTAEYYWAGRIVLERGSFEDCRAAVSRRHATFPGSLSWTFSRDSREEA